MKVKSYLGLLCSYGIISFSASANEVLPASGLITSVRETPESPEKNLDLDEVVVTGTRTEKRLSEVPVLTTVIKEEEIRRAGAASALETLQDNLPGVVISPNAMGNNMRIKGLNSRYILFLVDGERMVSEGAGGNINLDQIDVDNIERIEVINGAASSLYGSNAVGAVINIITKKPKSKVEAGANVIGESNNTWKYKVEVGSSLKNFTTRVSGFRNTSDGFGGDGNGPYNAKYEDMGANFNMGVKMAERFDVNITGRFFSHETFNPANSMNSTHALKHNFTGGAALGYVSSDSRNTVRLSVNWDKYLDYKVLEKKDDEKDKQNEADYISARLLNTFKACESVELVGGLEYNHEELYAIKTLGVDPTSKTVDDANVFAQADWKIIRNLNVVAGARYTYNDQYKSSFNPKLSMMYSPGRFRFRGSVGTAFRAPSIKELYYDFDHQGSFWVYGNPDLKAEKGLYSSLSAEITCRGFNASVSGYYNDIDNKITQYDVINEIGGREKYYMNVSSATLKGIDVNMTYNFLKELTLKATYSFCDAKDNSTGLQLTSNVKHSGTASLTWSSAICKSPFSLQFAGRMNSPILYHEAVTDSEGVTTNDLSESKMYSIWKLTLVKPVKFGRNSFELTAKCDNIFNFSETAFINPGRQYMVGLRYMFR